MQSSTYYLVFSLEDLLVNPQQDPHNTPLHFPFQTLKRFVEHGNTNSMQIPANVGEIARKFYNECVEEFVKIRETPKKLTDSNNKAINYLQQNKDQGMILSQLKCEFKPIWYGSHVFQTEAAKNTNEKIANLLKATQLQCQEFILETRQNLKIEIDKFDIFRECVKIAQEKWVVICGGTGQPNFFDRNYRVNCDYEATSEELGESQAGSSNAIVTIAIPLSRALFILAYHQATHKTDAAEALAAAQEAEKKRARDEALAKKSAAEAAAANRPTAETQATICEQMTKEITHKVVNQIMQRLQNGSLNIRAAPSQYTQRETTATRGRSPGGNRGGGNAANQQRPQTPNRGGGGGAPERGGAPGRGRTVPGMPPQAPNTLGRQASQSASQGRQPNQSASPRRQSTPPPQDQRRVFLNHNQRPVQDANVYNRENGRGRGTTNRGRGRGRGRGCGQTPTSPHPRQ